jgi:hypothetical protein
MTTKVGVENGGNTVQRQLQFLLAYDRTPNAGAGLANESDVIDGMAR